MGQSIPIQSGLGSAMKCLDSALFLSLDHQIAGGVGQNWPIIANSCQVSGPITVWSSQWSLVGVVYRSILGHASTWINWYRFKIIPNKYLSNTKCTLLVSGRIHIYWIKCFQISVHTIVYYNNMYWMIFTGLSRNQYRTIHFRTKSEFFQLATDQCTASNTGLIPVSWIIETGICPRFKSLLDNTF